MDPSNVSTVVYQINETLKEDLKNSPKYTVTRLDYTEEIYGDKKKKTFYIDDPSDNKDELVILSFGKDRVVINMAVLQGDKITISKKPTPLKFNTLFSDACDEGGVVDYFLKMQTVSEKDRNANFLNNVKDLIQGILYKIDEIQMMR